MNRHELLDAYVEVATVLKASESWEQSYRDSPRTFKRLVRQEAQLQADVGEYLVGLSSRVDRIVNWSEVKLRPLYAAAVPPESDDAFKAERALLYASVYPSILELLAIGGQAGEILYSRPIGLSTLSEYILHAAAKHTAGLVTDITSTTRGFIRQAIEQSIAQGEDFTAALTRIRQLVANPARAELIASTESVNAYQRGLERFAQETGAKSKTWDALRGACQLCSPLEGKTIRVDRLFVLPNGREVSKPSAHPRCRCGLVYNYPN